MLYLDFHVVADEPTPQIYVLTKVEHEKLSAQQSHAEDENQIEYFWSYLTETPMSFINHRQSDILRLTCDLWLPGNRIFLQEMGLVGAQKVM